MGIYDRDYYRQGRSGFRLSAPRSAVGAIILLNVAVFVLQNVEFMVSAQSGESAKQFSYRSKVIDLLSTHVDVKESSRDTLLRPWMWWQLLTYGFVHAPYEVQHILFNMLTLFFLGRDVEQAYGTREFIRLYLAMLVFAAVVWAVADRVFYPIRPGVLYGASGAIAGVVVLYALNFPKRILVFMFVLPLPAWLLGALAIGYDILGAMGRFDQHVAYTAHLAGAAFALAYFHFRWNVGRFFASVVGWLKVPARPSLKVFKPQDEADAHFDEEDVDRILAKLSREGESSLTRKERRVLENASREYQRRRRQE